MTFHNLFIITSTADPDQSDKEVARNSINLSQQFYTIIFFNDIMNKNNKKAFSKNREQSFNFELSLVSLSDMPNYVNLREG